MTSDLPEPVRAFDDAQRRTLDLARDVVSRLQPGMSARDVTALAVRQAAAAGFTGWFHTPEIRIGAAIGGGGPLSGLRSGAQTLAPGALISLDLGPAIGDAYGDLGITVSMPAPGAPEPEILTAGRDCVRAACGYSSRWKTMGEIVIFSHAWARNRSMELLNTQGIGHRILPKEGLLRYGFPRSAHWAARLARNRLHRLNPVRMDGMFAINPVLRWDGLTVSFEEVIYIREDVKRVLGRGGLSEVGTL